MSKKSPKSSNKGVLGASRPKNQRFDVFFQQINRQVIEVSTSDPEKAAEKASRIWRRHYGWPTVDGIQTAESTPTTKRKSR